MSLPTFPITLSESATTAICLPFNVVIPEGIQAYDVAPANVSYDEYLKAYTCTFSTIASPGETLKGGTPAIVNSGIGEYYFIITTSESAMKGSFPQSLLRGNYMEPPPPGAE